MTLLFMSDVASTLKWVMERAYGNSLLSEAVRASIGHIRNDFYNRFYGLVLDHGNDWRKGVLLAAIIDLRTKTPQLPSDEDKYRTGAALDRHMKDR